MRPISHIKYHIDKEFYRNLFYENVHEGTWHHSVPGMKSLYWYQLFIEDDSPLKPMLKNLEIELNIEGMNNFPRFSYNFRDTKLEHHMDEDEMVSININILDTKPTIHIDHKPYPYECALIDVGHYMHGIEPDKNDRLILKFCLRHSWDEVYDRLQMNGLV